MKKPLSGTLLLLMLLTGCSDSGYTPSYIISDVTVEDLSKQPEKSALGPQESSRERASISGR